MDHYTHALEILGTFMKNPIVFSASAGVVVGSIVFAEIMRHKHERKQAKKHEHR